LTDVVKNVFEDLKIYLGEAGTKNRGDWRAAKSHRNHYLTNCKKKAGRAFFRPALKGCFYRVPGRTRTGVVSISPGPAVSNLDKAGARINQRSNGHGELQVSILQNKFNA